MSKKTLIIKTRYGHFSCLFEPGKDNGGYVVEARGINGAITWGKNLAEARKMIREAIEGAIEASAIAEAEKRGIVQLKKRQQIFLA